MGCSGRQKAEDIRPEEKWDFISLQDFKTSSFFEYLAYGYLWCSLFISTAVYGVDTFTAYNLLALDKFTSIKPTIDINISKWIFAGCIIASWVNVLYEHFRAWRIMKRGAVAESYLDSLAVRLQSVRVFGKARGWKRFLVFSELTKSKKGAEYIALFSYFSFKSWFRVIFCSGPRQVINALTLREVYMAQLDPKDPDAASSILKFFENFGILAQKDSKQAVILSGMLFTLIVWVFAALSLLTAVLFYLLFLWHYIPSGDGGLSGYCERKINGRLRNIVSVKINKAIEEEERQKVKADQRALKNGEKPAFGRQATLPTLFDPKTTDKLPPMPMLNRNDTNGTLPQYTSRPGTPSSQQLPKVPDFELSNLDQKRPAGPSRLGTAASSTSASSYATAPLIAGAAGMGYGRSGSPAPSLPDLDGPYAQPQRAPTAGSNASQWQRGPLPRNGTPGRQLTQEGDMAPPQRGMTPMDRGMNNSPMDRTANMTPMDRNNMPMDRNNTPFDRGMNSTPMDRNNTPFDRSMSNTPMDRNNTPFDRGMNNTPMDRNNMPMYQNSPPLDRSVNNTPMDRNNMPMYPNNPPLDRTANMTPMDRNNPPFDRAMNNSPMDRTNTPMYPNNPPVDRNNTPFDRNNANTTPFDHTNTPPYPPNIQRTTSPASYTPPYPDHTTPYPPDPSRHTTTATSPTTTPTLPAFAFDDPEPSPTIPHFATTTTPTLPHFAFDDPEPSPTIPLFASASPTLPHFASATTDARASGVSAGSGSAYSAYSAYTPPPARSTAAVETYADAPLRAGDVGVGYGQPRVREQQQGQQQGQQQRSASAGMPPPMGALPALPGQGQGQQVQGGQRRPVPGRNLTEPGGGGYGQGGGRGGYGQTGGRGGGSGGGYRT